MMAVTIMKKQNKTMMKKSRVGMFKNMGGNFPGGNFSGGSFMGGNFPGGSFPDTGKIR